MLDFVASYLGSPKPRLEDLLNFKSSLLAPVLSQPPWCVQCSPHAYPTSGVGGVWWQNVALTLAPRVAAYSTMLCRASVGP